MKLSKAVSYSYNFSCFFLMTLKIGLPIEVRDKALAIADTLPRSDVNKEFFHQTLEKEVYLLYIFSVFTII